MDVRTLAPDECARIEGDLAPCLTVPSPELCQGNADAVQCLADRLEVLTARPDTEGDCVRVVMDDNGHVTAVETVPKTLLGSDLLPPTRHRPVTVLVGWLVFVLVSVFCCLLLLLLLLSF